MTHTEQHTWLNAMFVFSGGMVVWVGVLASLAII